MKKYSIIIPFHSNANLLSLCVESIKKSLFDDYEIIIVDNNSIQSQLPKDLSILKDCNIIHKKENLLYPKAINLGVENANGQFLIFCDADIKVCKNFASNLTQVFENEEIGFASGKLLNIYNKTILDFGITSTLYNFPHPYLGREQNFVLCSSTHEVLAGCAACSAIPRKLFFEFNGFDEELIHSYSDIDLCLRLKNNGYKTMCVASSVAYHMGSSTIGSNMSFSLKEDTKGIFMSKHKNIPILIGDYLNKSCQNFLMSNCVKKNYLLVDLSTIGDSNVYIKNIVDILNININDKYRKPYAQRDAAHIDLLNFVPHQIRNYKVPIIYFVDTFCALKNNALWQECRNDYADIVVDRHTNVLLLSEVNN